MPSSDSSRDALLERLAEELVERHRRGEHPALSEYTDRHPDLAAEIRDLFPALVRIEFGERIGTTVFVHAGHARLQQPGEMSTRMRHGLCRFAARLDRQRDLLRVHVRHRGACG